MAVLLRVFLSLFDLIALCAHSPFFSIHCFLNNLHALSVGDYSTSVGTLGFLHQTNQSSVSDVIDELSTLITAGRLSAENKQVMLVSFLRQIVMHSS